MNRRLLTILLSAFAIAAVSSFAVYRIVSHHITASPSAKSTVVIAAAHDLKVGTLVKASDLTTIALQGNSPEGVVVKPEDAVGRGVLSEIYAGEPIMNSRLAVLGAGAGLAATIPTGSRAVALKVNDVVGVSGFATPGMKVDVLISGNPPGVPNNSQGTLTKTLLQNITVLSAGADITKDAEGKPHEVQVVNLLVTPEQAQKLSLAGNETHIQLVLRNPLDTAIAKPPETSMSELFADPNAPPEPRRISYGPRIRRAPVYTVQVLNGSKQSESKFPAGEEKQ
jgi:pilus assembly protein CpaB